MKVAVGLSGGVDSAMAAWLLKRQGHELVGITMQIWDGTVALPDIGRAGCYGPGEARDIKAASDIAARLGIQHLTVPLAEAYKQAVLAPFRAAYRAGRTPNPCVLCNQLLKFGLLLQTARAMGISFDAFATGHYARVAYDTDRDGYTLRAGTDAAKDQSYFLARLNQSQLARILFPLGNMTKPDVIALARQAGFADVAGRAESQDFIESDSYDALFQPEDSQPGQVVDTAGKLLGRHRGIIHFTVGQRHRLGVATGERMYVKELRPATHTVVLGRREEVFRDNCLIEDPNWIAGEPPPAGSDCVIRLRYRHPGVAARLQPLPQGIWQATFAEPQFAVAPGQAAVCYRGDEVLGGGWIA
ncbi:MAG: tRNA 2-thiouridine(34) synthase MnmA [Kiritimatiellae bacterium]|nr:tRNA 2-thiouridine(34) synthase MnmA [Kiritimatiellia bacterium]